ncbi:exodeoxyribonuclease VII small subunit [Crocosphaera sp. XPORK-15E]|uniref:exodeoxyribonuclease VII small subunit n=1 Tax=Crocosphaera sp. XPORK-15E TaxID=3110247 RepID=UPI002B1FDF99|nr:exodeoxyribonuclease VII small subunit [Crocosphaera sp. XPORK-15E]MEA5537366.1 exodeoxyribonuclease VII small subunit [Crocosphaera sp. XPORK-15E]
MDSLNQHKDPWNYEASVAEVEAIIENLESGDLPLNTVFSQFEVAVQQIRQCEQFLNQGKERMDLLIETLEEDIEF